MSYVYRFINKQNDCIYVGYTSQHIATRIGSHLSSRGHLPQECYDEIYRIDYREYKDDYSARRDEVRYIQRYDPTYNTMHKRRKNVRPRKIVIMEDWKVFTQFNETDPIPSYVKPLQYAYLCGVSIFGLASIIYMFANCTWTLF